MTKVAIVGAGITGLSAALTLRDHADTVVLEAGGRVGGKLFTTSVDGVQVEAGADSFIVRDDELIGLCRSLGLEDELIEPAVFSGLVLTSRGPRPLPRGTILGVPASPGAILRAEALSPLGKLRALGDLVLPGPLTGPDVAAGPFIRRRFGSEVADTLVDPLLAGTRAGSPEHMSLAAALPPIDEAARRSRSVMRGFPRGNNKPRFLTLRGGIATLALTIAERLPEVRLHSPVRSIEGDAGNFLVELDNETIEADAVIVAAPTGAAADLVAGIAPEAATGLDQIEAATVASVVMVYDGDISLPEGSSGMLIPSSRRGSLSAATWWSRKWPHTSRGKTVIRAFLGRSDRDPIFDRDDAELVAAASSQLSEIVGPLPEAAATAVHRWEGGLPQYRVGHLDLVSRISEALPPGVAVVGAGIRGSGIPDCYRQGTRAAAEILASLQGTQR